jgi:hypothetical protein
MSVRATTNWWLNPAVKSLKVLRMARSWWQISRARYNPPEAKSVRRNNCLGEYGAVKSFTEAA